MHIWKCRTFDGSRWSGGGHMAYTWNEKKMDKGLVDTGKVKGFHTVKLKRVKRLARKTKFSF